MQNYDWVKDATLAEEHAMVAAGWDTENVKLGPVRQRYRQPSLVFDDFKYQTMLRRARTAIDEREAAEIKVCCAAPHCSFLFFACLGGHLAARPGRLAL